MYSRRNTFILPKCFLKLHIHSIANCISINPHTCGLDLLHLSASASLLRVKCMVANGKQSSFFLVTNFIKLASYMTFFIGIPNCFRLSHILLQLSICQCNSFVRCWWNKLSYNVPVFLVSHIFLHRNNSANLAREIIRLMGLLNLFYGAVQWHFADAVDKFKTTSVKFLEDSM